MMLARISRTMARDGISRDQVLSRIKNQMEEEEKMALCDFIIENNQKISLLKQVIGLHQTLLVLSKR